jgi:hypothetical protein
MNMQNVGIFIFREGFNEKTLGVSGMNMQHCRWSLARGSTAAGEHRKRSNGSYCSTGWLRVARQN